MAEQAYSSISAVENRLDPAKKALYDSIIANAIALTTGQVQTGVDAQGNPIYSEGYAPGEGAFSRDAYMRNIAPLTGLEQAAYLGAAQGVGQFQPFLQDARNLYGEQAALTRAALPYIQEGILGTRYGQDLIDQTTGVNPFIEQVADTLTDRLQEREAQQLVNLEREAAAKGALGGSRFGLERSNIQRDTSRALTEGLGQLYASEFQNRNQRLSDAGKSFATLGTGIANLGTTYGNLGNQLGNVGSNVATLGTTGQDMYQSDIGTALGYGQSLRDYNQLALDTAQENIYAEESRPFQDLGFVAELGGLIPSSGYGVPTPFPIGTSSSTTAAMGVAGYNPFGGGSV
tara:strand:- start:433 stop:1467 length:1035 start_codon:yes stop_codon:yes gene_type:complete